MEIRSQSWKDVEDRFNSFSGNPDVRESMLAFVADIQKSPLADALYPWTSMLELRITQTKVHPFQNNVPFLHISPRNDGTAEFRYVDTMNDQKQWIRHADKGRLTFPPS